jgi:hypothetical protein
MLAAAAATGAGAAVAAAAGGAQASDGLPPTTASNFGQCPDDKALRAAWTQFCRRLEQAGDRVFKAYNPATPLQRVDGFRYLTQNLSQAFDLGLETKDTKYPALHLFCSPTRKLGSDNADCIYMQAWIDGDSVYKISGKRGTARMWNIAVQGPRRNDAYFGITVKKQLHDPFGDAPEANIFGHELKMNWDDTFELYIGGPKRGPNWLPTTKGSRKLFLRQYFDSWDEEAAEFRIERVGMEAPRPIPTPQQMIEAIDWAGNFCFNAVDQWPDWDYEVAEGVDPKAINKFNAPNLRQAQSSTGDTVDARRGRLATAMRWAFQNDEALIIEFDAYDGYYMFTNEGQFGNSMDYLYRPVSFTPSRTAVDPDNKIRIIMTAKDPGYANWLDNQGYTAGLVTFRNVFARVAPELRTNVVKVAELSNHIPAGAKRATPEERIAQMHARFDAIRRRYRL